MNATKRRSLRERDYDAIAEARLDTAPAEVAPVPAPAPAPVALAPRPRPRARASATPRAAEPGGVEIVRLGTYWQMTTYDEARAAYVVDLDLDPDALVGFSRWVEAAIARHTARSPQERAQAGARLGDEAPSVGIQRSCTLHQAVIDDAEAAITADRRTSGRVLSLSRYIGEAARTAASETSARLGGPLPPPPAKLPTRPRR